MKKLSVKASEEFFFLLDSPAPLREIPPRIAQDPKVLRAQSGKRCSLPWLANLRHACPKRYAERYPWHAAATAVVTFSFLLHDQLLYIVKNMCVYIYIHMSECLGTVCEWPLLPNSTAREAYLHKTVTVWSVNWIFIIGAPAWRWLGECVTLDRTFYCLHFKQEVAAAPVTSRFSSFSYSSRTFLEI